MKNILAFLALAITGSVFVNGQPAPTGNPKDFRVKTCLHSVSYMGIWRGQATLPVRNPIIWIE